MDLQKHKNVNNAQVEVLMREMQKLIDSTSQQDSNADGPELGDLSAITPERRLLRAGEAVNESSFIEPGPYFYSPHLT